MNHLDRYSPADPTPAEESAFDHYVSRIGAIDGRALFAEEPDMAAWMLDTIHNMFQVPHGHTLFAPAVDSGTWAELDEGDRAVWETLANAARAIAHVHLDEDRARSIAADTGLDRAA